MGFRRLPAWASALCIAVTAAGCSDAGSGADGTAFRDSAGIAIAESDHTRPAWGTGGWRLSEAPILEVGSVDAEGPEQFLGISDARFLPSGDVAVVDLLRQHLVIFDGEGQRRRTIGRDGDGPGEFRMPRHVHAHSGDSLLVVEGSRAVSLFDSAGGYSRRFTPGGLSGMAQGYPSGQFGDGTLLFLRPQPDSETGRTEPGWNEVEPIQVGVDGAVMARFGNYQHELNNFGAQTPYLLAPLARFVPDGDGFWYARGDRFEIRWIGMHGRVVRVMRLDLPRKPVTPADIEEVRQLVLESVQGTGLEARTRERFARIETPEFLPAYDRVLADDEGNLWVEEYRPLEIRAARTLWVFNAEGRYLGTVGVPAGFTPLQVASGKMIGRYKDESDVEFVRVYGIVK